MFFYFAIYFFTYSVLFLFLRIFITISSSILGIFYFTIVMIVQTSPFLKGEGIDFMKIQRKGGDAFMAEG